MLQLFLFSLLVYVLAENNVYESRGLPAEVNWISYKEALEASKENGKPVMLLFTKTWCGACKTLKSEIKNNLELFIEASKKLNIVNIEEEADEVGVNMELYSKEGSYIPRIFFLDLEGNIDDTAIGPNAQYKRYFPTSQNLIDTMTQISKKYTQTEKTDL